MPLPFQPAPGVVELAVQWVLNGQQVENKFYAHTDTTITASMVAALANVVANWAVTRLSVELSNDAVFNRVVARDLTTESGIEVIDAAGSGTTGGGGSPLPNNATLAIHRDTGFGGKKAKSRIYQIGLPSTDLVTPNTVSTASAAGIIDCYNDLRSAVLAITSPSWTYGYLQRVLLGSRLTTANFIEVLGHSLVDLILDSQRRRLPGRGV